VGKNVWLGQNSRYHLELRRRFARHRHQPQKLIQTVYPGRIHALFLKAGDIELCG
jgi:hypothetical protein